MTTLTATLEDPLLIRVRELRTMIEDPAADNASRQDLTRGYFRLLRRLKERGVNFYAQPQWLVAPEPSRRRTQ